MKVIPRGEEHLLNNAGGGDVMPTGAAAALGEGIFSFPEISPIIAAM
jgi:hypothetical protein